MSNGYSTFEITNSFSIKTSEQDELQYGSSPETVEPVVKNRVSYLKFPNSTLRQVMVFHILFKHSHILSVN